MQNDETSEEVLRDLYMGGAFIGSPGRVEETEGLPVRPKGYSPPPSPNRPPPRPTPPAPAPAAPAPAAPAPSAPATAAPTGYDATERAQNDWRYGRNRNGPRTSGPPAPLPRPGRRRRVPRVPPPASKPRQAPSLGEEDETDGYWFMKKPAPQSQSRSAAERDKEIRDQNEARLAQAKVEGFIADFIAQNEGATRADALMAWEGANRGSYLDLD
ncbi:MAG: hypothetical protein ACYS22_13895 [Planctomycetota bacterium]